MTCGIECIDKWLTKAFYRLGHVVAKHPGYFLIVPVFLTIICITGFQRVQFEIDPEYLFSPEHGPGKTERAIVESHFKMNYSSLFNPTRITRPGAKIKYYLWYKLVYKVQQMVSRKFNIELYNYNR
jgi:hypothetical protein